jgi:DNA polymerase I-like protein with 3'-5' exonuclease and polymerase domains
LEYLKWKNYKILKNRKTGKPTADATAIEKTLRTLALEGKKDPLLEEILKARGLQKAIGYLLEANLGADSKYHPIYTFRPETGRLSAVRPNIQNQPNHGVDARVAEAIRACVVPSQPGRILLECDWKAMEAVLTGYFAQDDDYIAISQKDSHSYFCAFILQNRGIIKEVPSATDPGLDSFLTDIKKRFPKERFTAKTANLAMGYDIGWRHLSEVVRCSAAEAKDYIRIRDEMYPKLAKWKEATFLEAHTKGYLETPFSYRTYYWNVLEPVKGQPGKFVKGKEAREALAFRPQSCGAAMLREVMLDVDKYDGEVFFFLAPIHDAILVECEERRKEETTEILTKSMQRKWPELGGLSIEAETKTSRTNWSRMK